MTAGTSDQNYSIETLTAQSSFPLQVNKSFTNETSRLTSTSIDDSPNLNAAHNVIYVIYWLIGSIVIVCNGLLGFVIVWFRNLRRESNNRPLVAGLAISDVVLGVALLSTAISYFTDPTMDKVPPLACMKFVYAATWWIGPIFMPLYLASVSLDRLICVLSPHKYVHLGRTYIAIQLSVPVIITAVMYIIAWILAVQTHKNFTTGDKVMCYRELVAANDNFIYFYDVIQVLVPLAAVLTYSVVMIVFYTSPKSKFSGIAKAQRDRENQITKTLGIMAMSTTCFYVLPSLVQSVIHYVPSLTYGQNLFLLSVGLDTCSILQAVHSIANFSIYVWKAGDVRRMIVQVTGIGRLVTIHRNKKHVVAVAPLNIFARIHS